MADLGLNDHHQSMIMNFLRFTRYQRAQNVKSVEHSFKDVINSCLLEDTYTADEVRELLTGLSRVVSADVETELMSSAHTNILLLKQLFTQAEEYQLNLQPDLSEIENQGQLEMIKKLEDKDCFSEPKLRSPIKTMLDLVPISNSRPAMSTINTLKKDVDRLKQEKEQLLMKNVEFGKTTTGYVEEIRNLRSELELTQQEMSDVKQLTASLSGTITDVNECKEIGAELVQVQHLSDVNMELKVSQENLKTKLHVAEQELERKFSKMTAYGNLMKILGRKNETIKNLREMIKKYEPEDTTGIIAEEDE